MQYVRQAGSDPSFLLKALGEASGELRHALAAVRPRQLLAPGAIPDDGWTLLGVAVHMREAELGTVGQLEAIITRREPDVGNVDLDDIPVLEEYRELDEDDVLDEFQYYRRHTAYLLWDLDSRGWERAGNHPYLGRITVLDIAREMYRHDLEHLWQVRRMIAAIAP